MKRVLLWAAAVVVLSTGLSAETAPQQFVTGSWHGLSGLYIVPTARMLGQGRLSLGYNESKHVEFLGSKRFSDRQTRGVATYGLTDSVEVSAAYTSDLLDIADGARPQLGNEDFATVGLKARLLREKAGTWQPDVSLAVRDLFDDTRDVGVLEDVNNGRKFFLLASKRLAENENGRFLDAHAGLTHADSGFAGLFGFELAISPVVSITAEGMWDAPYLNFREIYEPDLVGDSDAQGRFVYATGLRFYPELPRGMVVDLGFVGDGSFEFAFGLGYVMGL